MRSFTLVIDNLADDSQHGLCATPYPAYGPSISHLQQLSARTPRNEAAYTLDHGPTNQRPFALHLCMPRITAATPRGL